MNNNFRNMTGYELSTKTVSLQLGWWSHSEAEEMLYITAIEKLKAEGWEECPKRSKGKDNKGFNWFVLIRQIIE